MEKLIQGIAEVKYDIEETDIKKGDYVFMLEIANMEGHCIVLQDDKLPHVGLHLDDFKLIEEKRTDE